MKKKKTVALTTLGCKVNQYETASLHDGFAGQGFEIVDFSKPADIYVINTCAVTAKAAAQSRQLIRRARRTNPEARVVVTGCYAQVDARAVQDVDGRLRIVDNTGKHRLVELMLADGPGHEYCGEISSCREIDRFAVHRFADHTRAFLKIQDGCNNFCSYCIVPYARGRSRSLPADEVIKQAADFARQGYKEQVVTGIHVGAYGHDLGPDANLLSLVTRLVREVPEMRYRISSLEPTEISSDFLAFMAENDTMMPHLHIPLQSGDDQVLKRMNRRYDAGDFTDIISRAVGMLRAIAIGVDVLVGFPGEDDAAFANTLALLEDLPVAYLHVFPYSKRPGTRAAEMSDQLKKSIKDERVACLRALGVRKRRQFYEKNLGRTFRVLAESRQKKDDVLKGFSENYIPVSFHDPGGSTNRIVTVTAQRLLDDGTVWGKIEQKK